MSGGTTRRVVLTQRRSGPPLAEDFRIEEASLPALEDGQVLLETRWVSIDPMLAIIIGEKPLGGGIPPLPIGAAIPAAAVSRVLQSRHSGFAEGDSVEGRSGWQERAVFAGEALRKVDANHEADALGVLGLPGFSAWCGINLAGDLMGKTLLVSGASGAVGGVAGQIGKARGARVIGIAGGPKKCAYLTNELGFDAALDHRAPDFATKLAEQATGTDVYFDNVGGDLLIKVLPVLARNAKILICGVMANYTQAGGDDDLGKLLKAIMAKSLRIVGFNNREYLAQRDDFLHEAAALIDAGKLRERQAIKTGLEGAVAHMAEMFTGDVLGKRLAKIS